LLKVKEIAKTDKRIQWKKGGLLMSSLLNYLGMSKNGKIKDSITLGLTSGFIATVVMDLFDYLAFRRKRSEFLLGHLSGSMMMHPLRTHLRRNFMLGQIFHMITGSVLGIPMVYIMKLTGKDNHLLKGATTGLVFWGILNNLGQRMDLFSAKARMAKTHFTSLWNNIIYGITAAQTIVSLGDPSLFPSNQTTQPNAQKEVKRYMDSEAHYGAQKNDYDRATSRPTDILKAMSTPALDDEKQEQTEKQMH